MRTRLFIIVGCLFAGCGLLGVVTFFAPSPVRAAATYTVGSTADTTSTTGCTSASNTTCTLRGAISLVNAGSGGDTITFNSTVFGSAQTITLASAQLDLNRDVTITGPSSGVTVRRDTMNATLFRIFYVNMGVTANVSNLTISGGFGAGSGSPGGGGILNFVGTVTLTNVTVSGNTSGGGGGIYNVLGTLTLINSTLSGNTTTAAGGGISSSGGTLTLTNSTVSGNTGSGGGGGFYTSSTTTVTNSTVTGNSSPAADGGGIYVGGGTTTVTNSTVTGNTTTGGGGGIFSGGTVTVTGSIVAGNTAQANSNLGGTVTDNGGNVTSGNPLLASLGNYGGPTQTMPPLPGSPAIDKYAPTGSNCGTMANPSTADQRGLSRPVNTNCDAGAVESRGFAFSAAIGTANQSATVGTAFGTALGVTVTGNTVAGGISEPVDGGVVSFTGPPMNASISPNPTTATIPMSGAITSGTATATVTANGTAGGPYTVTASASGTTGSATYSLTNLTLPTLAINDVTLNEGNAGTTSFIFTVSLSAPAGAGGVTFDIATADGTAVAPGDYTAKSLTGQTIPAGSSTYSFTVLVNGDTTPEANETFVVNVTNVTGATVTDGQGQDTITNDDAAPNLTINDVTLSEGNVGTTAFTFTVSLSAPAPAGGVTFDIATANGTATAGSDYTAKSLTGQTIPAGSSTYTFDVLVNGDTTVETNETFVVNVTNVTNAIVTDGQGQGTITNDDVIAACVVTTTADSGAGSLREKVGSANMGLCTGDTITFDPTVFNTAKTITLTTASGPLTLSRGVTITGPGANLLTIDGGCTDCAPGSVPMGGPTTGTKAFLITQGGTYAISGLTAQHGNGGNSGSGSGGAVDVNNGSGMASNVTLSLSGVTLHQNATANAGGAVATGIGTGTTALTITDSTISSNTALNQGGGIYAQFGSTTLTNVTISGNTTASAGGGIVAQVSSTTLTNVTVVGNTAPSGQGGGVYRSGTTLNATRSIVAGNAGGDVTGTLAAGSANTLIGDGSGGLTNGMNGNIVGTSMNPINPLLAPLGSYGGTTQTRPPLPGSPAIDAGGTGCMMNDQRGLSRPVNTTCDIGAVESQGFVFSAPTGSGQSTIVSTAFSSSLGATVTGNIVTGMIREPVDGGVVTFAGPGSGASINPATLTATIPTTGAISDGVASASVTANATAGMYTVTASASGTTGTATFSLTNRNLAPITSVVTNALDDMNDANCTIESCTLRQAANASNANDPGAMMQNNITFDAKAFASPQTITLSATYGTLTLTKSVTIDGTGRGGVTVSGGCTGCGVGGTPMGGVQVLLVNSGVAAHLTALTITAGNAAGSQGGGGILNNNGTVTLTNSTVRGNTATDGSGGGITNRFGTLTLVNSTVSGNNVNDMNIFIGGGIFNNGGTMVLTNSTVSGNSVNKSGGGIYNANGVMTLTNSTVSGNTATSSSGGGITNTGMLTRNNSIIAGNTGGDEYGSGFTGSNNLIGGNPRLAPLGTYGGPTQTMPPLPGSPAIDPASPATCSGPTLLDQRGKPRVGTCDIGAVESQGFVFSAPTGGGQTGQVTRPFAAPLTVTVTGNIVSGSTREPVDGGVVTFTAPMSGASLNPATLTTTIPTMGMISDGVASAAITANGTVGANYLVAASAAGVPASPATTFTLTNAPYNASVSPSSGDRNGGTQVSISGAGFVPGMTSVTIGGAMLTPDSITPTLLIIMRVPAHADGAVDVVVTVGGVGSTKVGGYTYGVVALAPTPPRASATPLITPAPTPPLPTPPPTPQGLPTPRASVGAGDGPTPVPAPPRRAG